MKIKDEEEKNMWQIIIEGKAETSIT